MREKKNKMSVRQRVSLECRSAGAPSSKCEEERYTEMSMWTSRTRVPPLAEAEMIGLVSGETRADEAAGFLPLVGDWGAAVAGEHAAASKNRSVHWQRDELRIGHVQCMPFICFSHKTTTRTHGQITRSRGSWEKTEQVEQNGQERMESRTPKTGYIEGNERDVDHAGNEKT